MTEKRFVAAIVLAAGSSSRMERQQHKLLLPLGDRPVVAHVVDAVLASQAQPILVVLGHQARQVQAVLEDYDSDKRLLFVENSDYKQGMSTSLRAGLQAMNKLESAVLEKTDGAIVLLGDQPLITAQIIDKLIATREATAKKIIAPLYHGKRGNPVVFSADLFSELMIVTGDEGGRTVIEHHRQDIATIEVGDSAVSSDVDTWSAYQQVVAEWQRKQERRER